MTIITQQQIDNAQQGVIRAALWWHERATPTRIAKLAAACNELNRLTTIRSDNAAKAYLEECPHSITLHRNGFCDYCNRDIALQETPNAQ